MAACLLAVLVNVLVARHYKRWDLTKGGLYTLSEPTVETLHGLEEPVKVLLLLPSRDPLGLSVSHLLDAYRAESSRVEVESTDPDRHPAEFIATQQRYGVVAGKTEDGRIVTDAAIIVVRGDRHHFVTSQDLIEVDDDQDLRARPKLELALTERDPRRHREGPARRLLHHRARRGAERRRRRERRRGVEGQAHEEQLRRARRARAR